MFPTRTSEKPCLSRLRVPVRKRATQFVYPNRHHQGLFRCPRTCGRRCGASLLSFPVLDAKPRRGSSLATLPGARHPVLDIRLRRPRLASSLSQRCRSSRACSSRTSLSGCIGSPATTSVSFGFSPRHRSEQPDGAPRSSVRSWPAASSCRSSRASRAVIAALAKHWRLAGFLLFALAGRVGLLPRDDDSWSTVTALRSIGSRTCRSTPAIRRGTPRPRSPSTGGSRSCSRRGSRTSPRGSASGSVASAHPVYVAFSRDVPRHASPAGHRRRSASSASPRCRPWFWSAGPRDVGSSDARKRREVTKVAVIAHAGKTFGGGLLELRRRARAPGRRRSAVGRSARRAGSRPSR